jgi:hypothetical protein
MSVSLQAKRNITQHRAKHLPSQPIQAQRSPYRNNQRQLPGQVAPYRDEQILPLIKHTKRQASAGISTADTWSSAVLLCCCPHRHHLRLRVNPKAPLRKRKVAGCGNVAVLAFVGTARATACTNTSKTPYSTQTPCAQ